MSKYEGLNCIMGEITMMASNEKNPIHEQHIYDYFTATEKFVRVAVPQLFADCMEQFKENLTVEFLTLLNGKEIHQSQIASGLASVLQEAIDKSCQSIKITFGV